MSGFGVALHHYLLPQPGYVIQTHATVGVYEYVQVSWGVLTSLAIRRLPCLAG